jgi:hypothetical protein
LLAYALEFGFEGAILSFQVGTHGRGVAVLAAFPILEARIADTDFTGDLGAGFAAAQPVLDGLAFEGFLVTLGAGR